MTRLPAPRNVSAGEAEMAQQIGWTRLPLPQTEYRFAVNRRWRFDFAWPGVKVALEVEGGTFAGGRHTRGAGFEADCEKYGEAALAGWLVLRVTTGMVSDGRALALLERALTARRPVAA